MRGWSETGQSQKLKTSSIHNLYGTTNLQRVPVAAGRYASSKQLPGYMAAILDGIKVFVTETP
jgi:hypothetical protein